VLRVVPPGQHPTWYIENEVKRAFEALYRNGWQATVSVPTFGLTD
jgi:hypothetical protein